MGMATRVTIGHGIADRPGEDGSIVLEGKEHDGKSFFWMGSFAAQALEERKILVSGILGLLKSPVGWFMVCTLD